MTGVQCGVTQIGDSDIGQTAPAGSQWCLATMNVKPLYRLILGVSIVGPGQIKGHRPDDACLW